VNRIEVSAGRDILGRDLRIRRWCRPATSLAFDHHTNEGGTIMLRRTAIFAAAMFAGTAFAFHCPQDMKKIDDALAKNPKITTAQVDEVKKYRTDGEALHKAGKHQESVDTLAKAMKILDIK